jgi:hypothetical protein
VQATHADHQFALRWDELMICERTERAFEGQAVTPNTLARKADDRCMFSVSANSSLFDRENGEYCMRGGDRHTQTGGSRRSIWRAGGKEVNTTSLSLAAMLWPAQAKRRAVAALTNIKPAQIAYVLQLRCLKTEQASCCQ